MFPERFWIYKESSFLKKNLIRKEKSGNVAKGKFKKFKIVTKIKKHN